MKFIIINHIELSNLIIIISCDFIHFNYLVNCISLLPTDGWFVPGIQFELFEFSPTGPINVQLSSSSGHTFL